MKRIPKKNGRPTLYRTHYAEQARKLCLLGYTDQELCDFFEVSDQTLCVWKRKHPKFVGAIKAGKAVPDAEVAASLLHRAMGYSHVVEKVVQEDGEPVAFQYTEKFAPDPTSMIFWLKNRQPAKWRDMSRHEVTGKDGGAVEVKHTPADIAAAAVVAKQLQDAQK